MIIVPSTEALSKIQDLGTYFCLANKKKYKVTPGNNIGDGLEAHYKFTDGVINDSLGNHNLTTAAGRSLTTGPEAYFPAVASGGYRGTSPLATNFFSTFSDNISVSYWTRMTNVTNSTNGRHIGGVGFVDDRYGGSGYGIGVETYLEVSGAETMRSFIGTGGSGMNATINLDPKPTVDDWIYVCWIFELGKPGRLHVKYRGTFYTSYDTVNCVKPTTQHYLVVGGWKDLSSTYSRPTDVSNVRIYNRALNDSEARELSNEM